MPDAFTFACPSCRAPLAQSSADEISCPGEGLRFERVEGIWRFLLPERSAQLDQFIREYATVRREERRGGGDAAYYRALPFRDLSGRFSADWRIRAASFRAMLHRVLTPREKQAGRPLRILDLGAGNCWLSNRLAERGHHVAGVDLQTNPADGLGAYIYYDTEFLRLQAEFDRLPLAPDQADLIIFNASFHYSPDYSATLNESLRVLAPRGSIVILDSPVYRDARSGEQMVREREGQFELAYGFASNALNSENYLTYRRLDELSRSLGLKWEFHTPFYGLRWALRPWKAHLLGRREPAAFHLLVGS